MRLVLISDTHGFRPELPAGDVLVHAGDLTMRGYQGELADAVGWLADTDFAHVVVIPGNHDFICERADVSGLFERVGLRYLIDEGTEIDGVKFWGSPVQPWFHDWAFNRERGADIRKHWDLIPEGTDVLVTHGPPAGYLDRTIGGAATGCADLREAVERIRPRLHVFGHIHEAYGTANNEHTDFVNASFLDLQYRPVHSPVIYDLPRTTPESEKSQPGPHVQQDRETGE